MFKFLGSDDHSGDRLIAYILSLVAIVAVVLIISIAAYNHYTTIKMAELGYQKTTLIGTSTLVYEKNRGN